MKCLYGTQSENIVAYCRYHKCGVTVHQMRTKNCLGKQCRDLEKNENHQYWHQREATKKRRKERKDRIDNYVNNIKNHN